MDPITIALGLAQFAPSILKFFGVGEKPVAVAERVVKIAQTVTGKASPDEATAAIRADPALAMQFQKAVLDADTELDKAYLADKANARERDIEVRNLEGGKNRRADVMVALDVVGLLAGLAGMLGLGVLKAMHPDALSDAVFGALIAQLATITSYFGLCLRDAHQFEFGSSRGSRDKDAALAQLTK